MVRCRPLAVHLPCRADLSDHASLAICALAPSSENSIIAYPAPLPPPPSLSGVAGSAGGSSGVGAGASGLPPSSTGAHNPASQPGDIVLFDALTLTTVNVIQAHKAPLAQLALNSEGTLLASASETGTVIRVWQVPGAEKVAQFRRGTYPARVCSLNFNLASSLLAVASDSDTIHIYKLPPAATGGGVSSSSSNGGPPPLASHTSTASFDSTTSNTTNGGPSPLPTGSSSSHSPTSSLFRRKTFGLAGSYVGSYLPTGVRDLWTPERDFAHVRLRSSGVRCVVALSPCVPRRPSPRAQAADLAPHQLRPQTQVEPAGLCHLRDGPLPRLLARPRQGRRVRPHQGVFVRSLCPTVSAAPRVASGR